MAKISGFCALRYNAEKVKLEKVVCPPYDVINKQQRKDYIKLSPNNIVKVVLPEGKNGKHDYKKAKDLLSSWSNEGILKKDNKPSFYIYVQECKVGKKKISRCGFLSLLKIEDKKGSRVLPHENVFPKPMLDRVKLMKETRSHLSPIFIVFKDKGAESAKLLTAITKLRKPDENIRFDGMTEKLWRVDDKSIINKLTKHLGKAKTFIADGHHRFAASAAVSDHFKQKQVQKVASNGHAHTLVYLVSSKDKGLLILPTHRAVKRLPKGFSAKYIIDKLEPYFKISCINADQLQGNLDKAFKKREIAFVILHRNKYFYIELKDKKIIKDLGQKDASYTLRKLDVSILHNLVFSKLLNIKEKIGSERNIYYYKGKEELIKNIRSGSQKLGVFLNPSTMDEVEKIAEAGEKMPHKSTYFYPKPLTGMVIHKF